MKSIILPIFFLLAMPAIAQNALSNPVTLQGWAKKLDLQSRMLPQEITFVHMDNSCYFQGDTIYYKSYVLRSDNGKLSDLSKVLYIELIDNDGFLIERQILKLENGQGWGTFCLADTLYSGFYELRAYTRWQLNWGIFEHDHSDRTKYWFFNKKMQNEYFRDYDKIYSRVFPIYDKPQVMGEYTQDMTFRPLQRYYRTEKEDPKVNVVIYPEGGDWIEAVTQNLAFEARFQNGKHVDGTLIIVDQNGKEVAHANTEHRGRGVVQLKAYVNEKLHAKFEWGENHCTNVTLPQIKQVGVALHTELLNDSLHLFVSTRNISITDSLAISILSNGMLQYYEVINQSHISIPTSILPNGIAQMTIYDSQGRIWADRQIFIQHKDLKPQTIHFKGLLDSYNAYSRICLDIEAPYSGTISLAVHDKALSEQTNDNGTLLTELLLSSQIKGFVEQPNYYFESTDERRSRHLDLLMMVQGWRRYSWHDLTRPFRQTQPLEKSRILLGEVYRLNIRPKQRFDPAGIDSPHWESTKEQMMNSADPFTPGSGIYASNRASGPITLRQGSHFFPYDPYERERGLDNRKKANGNSDDIHSDQLEQKTRSTLKKDVLVHAEFIQGESELIAGETMTENGNFSIPLPDFYNYCLMHVAASDSSKWKKDHHWIVQDTESNTRNLPEFYVRFSHPYPRFVKPYDFYQTSLPNLENSNSYVDEYKKDSTVYMREVTARIRRGGLRSFSYSKPAFKMDAYDAFNSVIDAGMHPPVYYTTEKLMLAIAANYIGEMGNKNRSYIMEPRWNRYNDSHFMDAVTLFHFRNLCYLDSVYVFTDYSPRKEGDKHYLQSNQPEVSVDFHLIPEGGKRVAYRDRFVYLQGFNVCEDFYQPQYDKDSCADMPKDYRRTLYWNPNFQLDENGHATIMFWNNCRNNEISITAEGITSDGFILTGRN